MGSHASDIDLPDGKKIRAIEAAHIADLIMIGEAARLSQWTADCYLAELKNPDAIMLRLVSDTNKITGFVVGRLVPSVTEGLDAEIYNIAVTDSEQGTGCGQALFDAFVDICHQRGVRSIWLEVRQSNTKAISFYKKNGFEAVQKRSHFYEDPREHGWLMRSDLTQPKA